MLSSKKIRKDFPIFSAPKGKKLIYLDNVATTQKPKKVIDAVSEYYSTSNSNIHRGAYDLSLKSSEIYEHSKKKVASFIGAPKWEEVIYTRNTTESINLVANSMEKSGMLKGKMVLVSSMEHHSNIVPWLDFQRRGKAKATFFSVTKGGELDLNDFESKLRKERPALVAVTHASNVLGTINNVKEVIQRSHDAGALVLVDGAQTAPHLKVDVQNIDSDFYAFSGHKMLAPFGIGVLHAKEELLQKMEPFMVGGDMISTVSFEGASWNSLPWKFEAGTPNIGGAVGLGAAIDYLEGVGMEEIHKHEQGLIKYAMEQLQEIKGTVLYGPAWNKRTGLIAFNLKGIHPHDVSTVLDRDGIAIRSGNHCAQPLMLLLGIEGACRAGFYLYNTKEEVDALIAGIKKAQRMFL